MFVLANFENALKADNSHYERFTTSSLHNLVQLLRQPPPLAPAATIAAQMTPIPLAKWRKYNNVKTYLLTEIPGLSGLVRVALGRPVNFHTVQMSAGINGRIKHTVGWSSSTANLADLGHVRVRERVSWPTQPAALQPHFMPEYRTANVHKGLGNSRGDQGTGTDEHDPVGPLSTPASLNYAGAAVIQSTMDQNCEYSDDGGANWITIALSDYTITRQLSYVGGRQRFTITKTKVGNAADTFQNHVEP